MANDAYDNARTDAEALRRHTHTTLHGTDPDALLDHSGDLRGYPEPHYDEDDDCPCPDHVAMRRGRAYPRPATTLGAAMLAGLLGKVTKEEEAKYGTDKRLFGFSLETRELMVRMIGLDPALEEAIYKLAELAFEDGVDSA